MNSFKQAQAVRGAVWQGPHYAAAAGSRDNYQQKLPWVRMLALPQVGTAIEVGY